MWITKLAALVLKRAHGELVATVGDCLMNRGSLTIRQIEYETNVKNAKVKNALLVLTQHGMVDYEENKQGHIEYRICVNRVINQIYFQMEAKCAGLLYGDGAEMMVEELLLEGRTTMEELVDSVTSKLNEAIKAQGAELREVQPSYVQDKFERLVATHFLKRCSVPVKNHKGKVTSLQPPLKKVMFTVPPKKAAGRTVQVKQEPTDDPPAKRRRISDDDLEQGSSADPETIYWEVNHPRFLHHFRDQMIVSAVSNALDSEKAAEIIRTILRHCEKTTDYEALTTLPVSFNEIHSQLPKDKTMTRHTLEQWLKLMTDNLPDFISKVGESAGGMYIINTFKAMQSLCCAHIVSVVEERHGSKARRIIQVAMKNKNIEQEMMERMVLMPGKQCRELIFSLIQDHFLRFTSLSKTPDQVANRSYYFLLKVDVDQVARRLLENSYQSLANMLLGQEYMLSDAKRLLEKQERIEAIMVSLGLPPSYSQGEGEGEDGDLEVDEEKREQVEAILETVTPAERQQLKKVKALTHHFEQTEQSLVGSTVFTLMSYLALTNRPPPPKPVKNLLA